MTFEEIFGLVVGVLALLGLIAFLMFVASTSEKSEKEKRELYKEIAKYYRNRNKQFEEDNK